MLTPEELRQIQRIHIQAGRKVGALFSGGYLSTFKGRGMEFEEVRPYVPGDDVRHIDWNVTARGQGPHVKEFREERQLTLILAVDVSASMDFGMGGQDGSTDKRKLMARMAGALALAAHRSGDQVGLLVFTDRVEAYLPPRHRRSHAWAVIRSIFEHRAAGRKTQLRPALEHLGRTLKRRSVVVLISDFLDAGSYMDELGAMAARHQVHCMMIQDPLERQLSMGSWLLRITDAESGQQQLVDPSSARGAGEQGQSLERALIRRGCRASSFSTMEDPFSGLERHFLRWRKG